MNKSWKVILAFVVIFVAGGAVGSVFTLHYAPPVAPKPSVPPPPEAFGVQTMMRWIHSKQLGLTPAQNQKIWPILFDTAEDLRRSIRENSHSNQLILEHMQDEITAQLTPQQRSRFDSLMEARRQQMAKAIQAWQKMQAQQRQQEEAAP